MDYIFLVNLVTYAMWQWGNYATVDTDVTIGSWHFQRNYVTMMSQWNIAMDITQSHDQDVGLGLFTQDPGNPDFSHKIQEVENMNISF